MSQSLECVATDPVAVKHPDFDKLWNYGDPAGTEAVFRSLLAEMPEGAERSLRLQLGTQIARTLGLQRKFEEAHAQLDEVLGELEAQDDAVARARYLLERGRALNSAGRKGEARPLFVEAWQLGCATGQDAHAVDAAHMVAIVEDSEGALRWNGLALELAERSTDERAQGWKGSLYNNLGWTHHDEGRYPEALAIFEKALEFRREQGVEANIRVARWAVARAMRSLGRLDEALGIQEELLREATAAGSPDGYVREELGELLWALGRRDAARPHFAGAWELLSADPWMAEHESERLQRLRELGEVE
jgi:tetratricopeptide (TPR) repeat protein